jgi:hypothetical protein
MAGALASNGRALLLCFPHIFVLVATASTTNHFLHYTTGSPSPLCISHFRAALFSSSLNSPYVELQICLSSSSLPSVPRNCIVLNPSAKQHSTLNLLATHIISRIRHIRSIQTPSLGHNRIICTNEISRSRSISRNWLDITFS